MAKFPNVPKALPKKPAVKAAPFVPQARRFPKQQQPPPPPPRHSNQNVAPGNVPKPLPYVPPPPPPKVPTEDELKLQAKIRRYRQLPLFVCGLVAFGFGLYSVQLWISLENAPGIEDVPADLSDRFDKEAEGYDETVDMAETLLRMSAKRRAMTEKVRGHVLEVAVGTGRNITYYPTKQCATVTLLDSSAPMVAVARRKWKDLQPEYFHRVFFKQQSALDPITPPYGAQDGYDTVLQTMGLCSTPEPVRLLRNIEAATKEDGRILLLEHGRSHYQWLNSLLDKTAPGHANTHGCWWNKDIGKIVEESGLEVVETRRYHLGTTWWFELRPRKGMRNARAAVPSSAGGEQSPRPPASQKPWWSFWG